MLTADRTPATPATCPEVYYVGRPLHKFVTCGRPVKRDGLCGTHANQRDRQTNTQADR